MPEAPDSAPDGAERIDASVLVPVLDEEEHIHEALAAMRSQRFDGTLEFLFLDGGSRDRTREIIEEAAAADARFRVLDNPGRRTPNALNVGLRNARGEYIVRMDAHTLYPDDYVANGVERVRRGDVAWAAGAAAPHGVGRRSRQVALALESKVGTGGSLFRHVSAGERDIPSGFAGVMHRRTLERQGGWDEDWPINQDAELSARIRKHEGRIVCLPEMTAKYIPRNSFRSLARQYLRYGHYRAKTSARHPETVRRSHLLPPALVLTLAAALVAPRALRAPARAGVAAYALALAVEGGRIARHNAPGDAIALPAIFASMHLTWGLGMLHGFARFGAPLGALRRRAAVADVRGATPEPARR